MFFDTFAWWLVIEGISLLVLPISLLIFDRLPGRGYAFAKPVGLLLGGYLFWMALSLHLLPNRPGSIVWALLPLALVSGLILKQRWREILAQLRERIGFVIAVEVVFLVALFVAAYLRSFIPDIAGTEKPMDFMLFNAADRSRYYPPDDPWLSGFQVSYYYFGYLIQTMLGKLTAVSNSVAFNLALAGTAALAVTAAFGLGYEIVRLTRRVSLRTGIVVGMLAILLVAVIGNLEGVLEFGVANGYLSQGLIDRVDIANLETARESEACFITVPGHCFEYPNEESSFWWWWRATRISPDAGSITEFPFFSFLLGDLHPHVMALPFVLTVFGLGLSFWRSASALNQRFWMRQPGRLVLAGVLIGGLGFLNAWDLPTFGFLVVAMVSASNLARLRSVFHAALASLGFLFPLAAFAAVLYLPFYLSFGSQPLGFDAVRGEATQPLHSALFWLPLAVVNAPLPVVLLARGGVLRRSLEVLAAGLLPYMLLWVWAVFIVIQHGFAALSDAIVDRGWNWLPFVFFAACLSLCLLALSRIIFRSDSGPPETDASSSGEERNSLAPVLVAMATAFLLILGSELLFITDLFSSRLNTVFKLSYQAWLLLGVSGAYSLWWLGREWQIGESASARLPRAVWGATAALVIAGAMLYPIGATLSRTEGFSKADRSLDGLRYVKASQRDDYDAVLWLNQRAGQAERLVEAVDGQYSAAARISAWTGIPTVLGWLGHEQQWGRSRELLGLRQTDVERAYITDSLSEALIILRKYEVTYVFVGSVERNLYPDSGLSKFAGGLPVAFSSGQTVIYRIPLEPAASLSLRP